ncbi:MAG: two-component system response regulator [Verrucomicrobiales bacterium]|nr:two-component system response regulator [Verrucomicrobiales bacterium]
MSKTSETPATDSRPLVLVVDDSRDDLELVEMAAKKLTNSLQWRSMQNGGEAISYITGTGKYSDRTAHPLPSLVVLDLKMPGVSGFDVLSSLSRAKTPKPPFICVLTTSKLEEDIDKATILGADAFHTKPGNYRDLCDLLQRVTTFFCR